MNLKSAARPLLTMMVVAAAAVPASTARLVHCVFMFPPAVDGEPQTDEACAHSNVRWSLDRPVKPGDDSPGVRQPQKSIGVIARLDRAIQYSVCYRAFKEQPDTFALRVPAQPELMALLHARAGASIPA
jgi:hypothetical protein